MMVDNTEIDLNEIPKSDYASSSSVVIGEQKGRERYILPLFGKMEKLHYITFVMQGELVCIVGNLIRNYSLY